MWTSLDAPKGERVLADEPLIDLGGRCGRAEPLFPVGLAAPLDLIWCPCFPAFLGTR